MRRACCLGCRIEVWTPRRGVVQGVFAGAVNLRFDEAWWTLLAADRPDQPSSIRLAPDTPDLPAVRTGDPAEVRAGHLRAGNAVVDCRTATRWIPGPWPPAVPGFQGRLHQLERAALPRAWAGAAAMARDVCEALDEDEDALADATRRVIGRGPGLTPSGDDVLVGLLTGLGVRHVATRERLARAFAPALPTTTSLSRHLLEEAALGLPGRPLHELVAALLSGVHFAAAMQSAMAVGATSGADTALGLVAGCRHGTQAELAHPTNARTAERVRA